jgi:hypothetical protein
MWALGSWQRSDGRVVCGIDELEQFVIWNRAVEDDGVPSEPADVASGCHGIGISASHLVRLFSGPATLQRDGVL